MGNIFRDRDNFPGAEGMVRRSLSQLELGHPSLKRLVDAANSIGVKYESPVWFNPDSQRGSAIAHIGFPKQKVAILTQHVRDSRRCQLFREAWEARGWRSAVVLRGDIDKSQPEKLAKDLSEVLGTTKGKRK